MQEIKLKIALIEDNDTLRALTEAFLQQLGHQVRSVSSAEDLSDATGDFTPDIYVVDLSLPEEDGLSLIRRIRKKHPAAGIVITTARGKIGERVEGYESGADLYLVKPVDPQELRAGIASLAQRVRYVAAETKQHLTLHVASHLLSGPQDQMALTPAESALLAALARAPGQTLERWQLIQIVLNGETQPSAVYLEMRMARLRKKLAAVGAKSPHIKALHKMGYQLCNQVTLA